MKTQTTKRPTTVPRRLDVLFVNPGGRERIYQNLGQDLSAIEPPIWTGLLAESTRRGGFSTQILDTNALGLSPRQAAERITELQPILTVIIAYGHNPNASTHVMPAAGELCDAIRSETGERERILLVGGHVAALPERTLDEESVDFVADGEGPYTIRDLLAALKASAKDTELHKVRGLVWRDEDGTVHHNPAPPLVTDLSNQMPSMAWDLLPSASHYRAHNWHTFGVDSPREPYAALYTTLGCPFRCSFCCIQAPFKRGEAADEFSPNSNSYRRFDPVQIVAQIEWLARERGVRHVKIADELFVLHEPHVTAICDGLIERGLGDELNIWAYARVDTCGKPRLLEKLRAAGVRWLAIGIESASEHVRADVDKGYRSDKLAGMLTRVQSAGIHILGNYIFGLPEDDHASMRATLDFAKEMNTEFANFFSAMAYPGSALYQQAIDKGWPLPASWAGYSQHAADTLPLPTRHLSGPEVLAFRDAAFHEYFDREQYRAMVHGTFGPGVLDEIEQMLAEPLRRTAVVNSR